MEKETIELLVDFKERFNSIVDRASKVRDELRELVLEVEEVMESIEDGLFDLEEVQTILENAADSFSKYM